MADDSAVAPQSTAPLATSQGGNEHIDDVANADKDGDGDSHEHANPAVAGDDDDDDGGYDGERAHSFRQRRLTYTRHHILSDSAAAAVAELLAEGGSGGEDDDGENENEGDGRSDTRKRGHADGAEADEDEDEDDGLFKHSNDNRERSQETAGLPPKRSRTRSDDEDDERSEALPPPPSTPTFASTPTPKPYLPSRILHAGEIVRRNSPASDKDKRTGLHSHPSHPEYYLHNHHHHHQHHDKCHPPSSQPSPANGTTGKQRPKKKWQTRFSFCNSTPDALLPFPRHVVGTYSCHGMEPLYDSDYENSDNDDDDEKDDDDKYGSEEEEANSPIAVITKKSKATTTAKINQDRGGVAYPYGNSKHQALFACYDGHGEGGEMVSQYALVEVQRLLEERLARPDLSLEGSRPGIGGLDRVDENEESVEVEPKDEAKNDKLRKQQQQHEEEDILIAKAFRDVFVKVDRGLLKEEEIEPMYSGTTACVVLMRQNKLFTSNVGDSRAVLTRRANPSPENNGETTNRVDSRKPNLIAIPLSIDQNPDSPGEKERILSSGGFVSPPPEPGLSARVWLDASHTQIGLAMARSIGDHAVKGVGVIAEPVVRTHILEEEDEFVIIASDGVWEFISSEEAVEIVGRHMIIDKYGNGDKGHGDVGASAACQALIQAASNKWHEHEGDYRDDITAIVIRLGELWPKK